MSGQVRLTLTATITYTPKPEHYPGKNPSLADMAEFDRQQYAREPVWFIEAADALHVNWVLVPRES